MKKLLVQITTAIAGFLIIWMCMSMLPWIKWLHIDELNKKRQKEFKHVFLSMHRMERKEITNDSARIAINDLKNKLCIANNIDTASIGIYLFKDAEINAFSIPGGIIVVNSALVNYCDNSDMLAGVIAHEIGHIQEGHIAKRMAKETGLSILMSIGGNNLEIIKALLRKLLSGKFDRGQEKEADADAVNYMQRAQVNPAALADFFVKMSKLPNTMPDELEWISTHPNAAARAKEVRASIKIGNYTPAVDSNAWDNLNSATRGY